MKLTFQILCPKKKCKKCIRVNNFLERFISKHDLEAEIIFVTQLDEMLEYKTWLLPSLFLNGKAVARGGYLPIEKDILRMVEEVNH